MSDTPRKWNTSRVLKVGGVIARQGVFTGHSPDLNGQGTPEFKESRFTPTVLEMITGNFKGNIPIYIDHSYDKTKPRKEIGRSFKMGTSEMRDSVSHEGFVWDPEGQKKIEEEGYNQVSPEFELLFDPQGNIVDAIPKAITYVKNPAIGGTEGQCMAMCFSTGPQGGNQMAEGDQNPPASGGQQNPPANPQVPPAAPLKNEQPPAQQPPAPPAPPVQQPPVPLVQAPAGPDPALVKQLNDLADKLKQYDAVMPGLIQQNEQMKTQQLGVITNSLKELGIDNPEALVEGLPVEGKIKALTQLQANLAKSIPLVKPPETMSSIAARAEADKAMFNKALEGLGLTQADYDRVMSGGKINA